MNILHQFSGSAPMGPGNTVWYLADRGEFCKEGAAYPPTHQRAIVPIGLDEH